MKRIIILLGIPGSGKGTQAKKIAQTYNYAHISTGDLLRALDKDEDAPEEDKIELAKMKSGGFVADELIFRLAFREIQTQLEKGNGVVLDGAIRNVPQAERYQAFFEELGVEHEVLVVALMMSDEVSFARLESRLKDGTGSGRADDTREALTERLKLQGNIPLAPIIEFYKERGVLTSVDATKSIEEVNTEVEHILETV